MILLDTNAIVWSLSRHKRAHALDGIPRLYISPASILEIQFLVDAGRVRLATGCTAMDVARNPRWRLDEPLAAKWFAAACELTWTRDPFDRLVAAHAQVRGWKLATADGHLLERLAPSEVFPL